MQFLKIAATTTLSALSKIVGDRNVDSILAANNLTRTPNIGKQLTQKISSAISAAKEVTWQAKTTILNNFTGDADVFEKAALSSSDGWKSLSVLGTFKDHLKIPETIKLKDSVDVTGGSGVGVSSVVYKKVMDGLKGPTHSVDPAVFNEYSTSRPVEINESRSSESTQGIYTAFNLPWGKITLYSSLSDESMDFPVYPEELSDSRKADYDTMPDVLYQYEPWYTYRSSGPRSNSYTFHFHRDMWSGNHLDGKANELIRFCEANCYPEYDGSAVNTARVTLYINGKAHISGIMTQVSTRWKGPIGQDGWWLECELELSITEIATSPLSYSSVRSKSIVGE